MICPYRKQTETVGGVTSEYYMECYGEECPYYYKGINAFDSTEYEECKRVESAVWEATHPYQNLTR